MLGSHARTIARTALLALAGPALVWHAPPATAECLVVSGFAAFDPPASGLHPEMRTLANSLGVSASARRLVVRYNYGYVVYGLATPSAPVVTSIRDLKDHDGYPKSGDGQTRTGSIALSADGERLLVPWTDTAAYGTIAQAFVTGSFGPGGDYLPAGYDSQGNAVAQVGTRYLAFTATMQGLWVADVTSVAGGPGPSVQNGIPSELVLPAGTDLTALRAVAAGGRSLVVGRSTTRVLVVDVTNPGAAVPSLSSGFTYRELSASALGVPAGSVIHAVAAAAHPVSGALYLLVQATRSSFPFEATRVVLNRVDVATGGVTTAGAYAPAADANVPQNDPHLLALESDLLAFLFHRRPTGGISLQARSSVAFSTNLAGSIAPFTSPGALAAMAAFRSSGTSVHLYVGDTLKTHSLSLSCTLPPGPAAASLAVDRIPAGGPPTPVPDGGSVFVGDELRIRPTFTPPDAAAPLLDWRLDYDFHDGNAADSQANPMRLANADVSGASPTLPPAELTLVGPCDPAQVPAGGPAPDPATGAGCWTSVTTNGAFGVPPGTPDFSAEDPVDTELTIAFEVQNGGNAGGSSLAKHRVLWTVPEQRLASTSVYPGEALRDGSDGRPAPSAFRWYFARVPAGEPGEDELFLETGCDGPSCSPSFTQAGQTEPGLRRPGTYRYWASVPYPGGFRTAGCPGLAGQPGDVRCAGSAARTVTVVDASPTHDLLVTVIGAGTGLVSSEPSGLSCGSVCSVALPAGTEVSLIALASAGSRFAGWSGSGCAGTGPCTVTMTGPRRVTAVFLPDGGTSLTPLAPCRVADTRDGSGLPLAPGEVRELPVVATGCGVPADSVAATMNVTVTGASAAGFLSVFPAGAETPRTQTTSFGPGRTRAAASIVLLGTGGAVRVYNASAGPAHVVLDVSGAFR